MRATRVRVFIMLSAAGFLLLHGGLCSPGYAGTIRDDREDAIYQRLSAQREYRCSGYLSIMSGTSSRGSASATLVAANWVLTAAHCVIDQTGQPMGDNWLFETGNRTVEIPQANVYFPRDYVTSGFDSGFDLALLYLPTPIRGVTPASLLPSADEIGKVITSVGYGTTGNGLTGKFLGPGTRRAGQNVVDAFAARIAIPGLVGRAESFGNQRTLMCDFDNPQATRSTLGSAQPLHLEYSAGPGDSGGGAFVASGSGVRILGVVSGGISPNGLADASYGTTVLYARVSTAMPWIRNVMNRREMPMPTLLAQIDQGTLKVAAVALANRIAAHAASGFRFTSYVNVPTTITATPMPKCVSPVQGSRSVADLGNGEQAPQFAPAAGRIATVCPR